MRLSKHPTDLPFRPYIQLMHLRSAEWHKTILSLFQPHIPEPPSPAIVHEARIGLETLIRLFYLRHSYECFNSMFLMLTAFIWGLAIEDLSRDSSLLIPRDVLHSTVILAAKFMESQGRCYYLANLTSLVMKSKMSAEDVQLVHKFTVNYKDVVEHSIIASQSQSVWPLPIKPIHEDHSDAIVSKVIKGMQKLNIEEGDSSSA